MEPKTKKIEKDKSKNELILTAVNFKE